MEPLGDGRLRICILSRKDLGPVTRVPREAQALIEEGHEVTVVSMKRPSPASIALTPAVEYHEITLDSWSRRRLEAMRARRKVKLAQARTRDRVDAKQGG